MEQGEAHYASCGVNPVGPLAQLALVLATLEHKSQDVLQAPRAGTFAVSNCRAGATSCEAPRSMTLSGPSE